VFARIESLELLDGSPVTEFDVHVLLVHEEAPENKYVFAFFHTFESLVNDLFANIA
jgi:hypothetical protein